MSYPELNEQGIKEAEIIIESFKKKLTNIAEQAISDLYVKIGEYIESDSWTNYRNHLMHGLSGYKTSGMWDWDIVRDKIFADHKDEIIKDLNQDLLKKIESLESALKFEREHNTRYR